MAMGYVKCIVEKIVTPFLAIGGKKTLLTEEHMEMENVKIAKISKSVHKIIREDLILFSEI